MIELEKNDKEESLTKGVWEYPVNAIRICVDSYGEDLEGRIYSRMSQEPLWFDNCSGMLLKADALFDERGYPQAFQEKRCFGQKKDGAGKYAPMQILVGNEQVLSQRGVYDTIDVVIQSRRRSGWQGMLLEEDGSPAEKFQSELELLDCIRKRLGKEPEHGCFHTIE